MPTYVGTNAHDIMPLALGTVCLIVEIDDKIWGLPAILLTQQVRRLGWPKRKRIIYIDSVFE